MASANNVTDKFNKLALGNRLTDSSYQSKRTKLHESRIKINDKINKELRMKAGASNLIELTKDKKLKSKINIEIDYFESNLKLWKDELEKANSALDTYQNMKSGLPMIPIAMKNTVEIDFTSAFRNVLSNHYRENSDKFSEAINLINVKRKKIQKPQRNDKGVDDHISYFNILSHVERRFFFPDQSNGIIFSWNDIFTGVPFQQRTSLFEKSGVIFNLASLYSQLAAAKDKSTSSGLEDAQTYLLSAEACFSYLNSSFINLPSMDLKPEILRMLSGLMKTQALECKFLLLKKIKMNEDRYSNLRCLELVCEAFGMSVIFDSVYSSLTLELLQFVDQIPQAWINLVQVKANYYRALAYQMLSYRYHQLGSGLRNKSDSSDVVESVVDLSKELKSLLKPTKYQYQMASNKLEAIGTAKMLLNEGLQLVEEAIKLAAMNTYLRNLDDLSTFLQSQHKEWLETLHSLNAMDSYDLLSCPELHIKPRSDLLSDFSFFDLVSQKPEPDPFYCLGPIEVFNSRNKIEQPRTVVILRDQIKGFGFTVQGKCPMRVKDVEKGMNAEKAGVRVGDVVLSVEDQDVRWASQETLVQAMTESSNSIDSSNGKIFRLTVARINEASTSLSCSGLPIRNSGGGITNVSGDTSGNLGRYHTISGSDYSKPQLIHQGSVENHLTVHSMGTSRKKTKLTWKERLSGTIKRTKSAKSKEPQSNSTLF